MLNYDKKWYKSKAVWASAAALVVAAVTAAFGEGSAALSIVIALLSAFGIYGRVTAKGKLTK